MARKEAYLLVFDPAGNHHLAAIDANYDSLIRRTIEGQWSHDPDIETRNRKPVEQPAADRAEWEWRFGPSNRFRVFYQINHAAPQCVSTPSA